MYHLRCSFASRRSLANVTQSEWLLMYTKLIPRRECLLEDLNWRWRISCIASFALYLITYLHYLLLASCFLLLGRAWIRALAILIDYHTYIYLGYLQPRERPRLRTPGKCGAHRLRLSHISISPFLTYHLQLSARYSAKLAITSSPIDPSITLSLSPNPHISSHNGSRS